MAVSSKLPGQDSNLDKESQNHILVSLCLLPHSSVIARPGSGYGRFAFHGHPAFFGVFRWSVPPLSHEIGSRIGMQTYVLLVT